MPSNSNDKFLNAFKGYESYYVLIGGTATSFILSETGLESRTTKDYDMVLIEEKRNEQFYNVLIKFLEDGEYTPNISEGRGYLYRFTTKNVEYPKMIELFSIYPKHDLLGFGRTTPISFADGLSLSALLLDNDYYDLLKSSRVISNGYSVINNACLITFKAKAWLDLSTRKERGESITSTNVKKHLNDIARLCGTLTGDEVLNLPESIYNDMCLFINKLTDDIHLIPTNDDIILDRFEIVEILKKLLI